MSFNDPTSFINSPDDRDDFKMNLQPMSGGLAGRDRDTYQPKQRGYSYDG